MRKQTIPLFILTFILGCHDNSQTGTVSPITQAPPTPVSPVQFTPRLSGLPSDGMWKCDPVFADINKDGNLDLLAMARLGDGPHVWIGDGKGNWTDHSQGLNHGMTSCGGGLDVADLNNDGNPDLVVADHCQGIFAYLGDGKGGWNLVTRELYPSHLAPPDADYAQMYSGMESVAIGDINADGFPDLLAGSSDKGGISLYIGDGTGANWTPVISNLPTKEWANRVRLHDMNGDGLLDVVASYNAGPSVWLCDTPEHWIPASEGLATPIIGGLYTGLAVADINEDGLPDIAIANWVDGPEVYLQQKDHSWVKTPDVFPQMLGGSVGLDLGDLDGDGHLDMVVSGRLKPNGGFVRGVFALKGDGKGNWSFLKNSGLPETGLSAVTGVDIADINGDGSLDVALASGLIVETVPGPKQPAIPQRLLVWSGEKSGNSQ